MLRALACAVTFLTRIPLPATTLDERDFAASAGYFAWVGMLIAVALWLVALATGGLGPRLSALLITVAWVAITGGLHLDGLADMVDGYSGGRADRARMLAIMRDSRIGAHGAVALCLALALKWTLLEALLVSDAPRWLVAPVAARYVCTLLMGAFPYARPVGLASGFAGMRRGRTAAIGAGACLVMVLGLGVAALAGAIVGGVCALGLALRAQRDLGGLTGDVYGAAIELCELGTLLSLAVLALH